MCGITGLVGKASPELLAQMTAVIQHRGPDDSGLYLSPDGQAGLGNRRLAIIDLSAAGHMPMPTADEKLWITYNGEIYNFPELRGRLLNAGVSFHSHTDTEVILHLYRQQGPAALRQLNGMFALALWDEEAQELVLARDRMGIKPLYYTIADESLIFGSEIKSLLLHPAVQRAIDPEALHSYLTHLWVPGPQTLFAGIHKLPPGHFLRWHNGRYTIAPYWQNEWPAQDRWPAAVSPNGRLAQALAQQLRQTLQASVQRNLIADVPIGLFLSGGLDSSTLLAFMQAEMQEPVKAYTIAFRAEDARLEQSGGADAHYADLVARHFGASLKTIAVDPDIVTLLPQVIWHLDEPVADPAAINTLLISQAAQPEVKVLLSGQGADELFGGYRVHLLEQLARPFLWLPRPVRQHLLSRGIEALPALATYLPGAQAGMALAVHRYFSKLFASLNLSPEERYLFNRAYYTQNELLALYSPERQAQMAGYDGHHRHKAYFAQHPDADWLNRILHVDLNTFLPELNLTYGDKLSMAASVEVRVPFLDNELVELMTAVPPSLKVHGLTGKVLLRQAMTGLLPPEIIQRRKAGFGAPIRRWLRHDLAEMMADLLSPATLKARGLFEATAVQTMIRQNQSGEADHTYRLWALLTLELWQRAFMP